MTVRLLNPRLRAVAAAALPLAALLAAPSQAQYKIVGSDGKVTYSDRMPSSSEARVSALGARSALTAPAVELPFELRKVAGRYPVTLYVSTGACEPCDAGRNLLKQRGIPYAEKQVQSAEDSEALEKLSGGRDAPTLTIGTQVVRGVSADLWNSYLDAAGYPRDSRLPANYQAPAPTPIVERREVAVAPAAPAVRRPVAEAPAFPLRELDATGIRF
jgi:glutaredoxin